MDRSRDHRKIERVHTPSDCTSTLAASTNQPRRGRNPMSNPQDIQLIHSDDEHELALKRVANTVAAPD
jgi:hypothetical protein